MRPTMAAEDKDELFVYCTSIVVAVVVSFTDVVSVCVGG